MGGRRLLLVDANSLANRAFYALPPLSTSKGVPTNAVYGFLAMLFRLIDERQPDYIICAFDHPSPTFRHAEFEAYKATRKPSPDEFKVQLPMLKEALSVLRISCVELPGYEADDIIGTLACKYSGEGFEVLILSGDKDCLQLVGEGREAILFVRGISQSKQYDRGGVKEDMGVWPEQIPDFKGLAGDQSDNIPGVKGIGAKTAINLLNQYDDIEQIFVNIAKVSPSRVQRLLKEHQEEALLSKRLAAIDCDAPCHVDVGDAKWEGPDVEKAREFFNSMEFQSLLRRLDRFEQQDAQASVSGGMSDTYELIDTEQRLRDLAERIGQSGYMSVYAGPGGITTGVHTHVIREFSWPRLLGISAGDRPYLIDFRSGDLACSDAYQDLMWKYLGPVLQDPEVKKFGFDLKWLYTLGFHRGIFLKGLGFDAMVGAYLLDPTRTSYKLDALVNGYLGGDMPQSIDDLPKDLRLGDDAARAHMAHLAQGAYFALRLADEMRTDLERNGLWTLARDVEFPMIEVLGAMEAMGIAVDLPKGQALRDRFAQTMDALEREIYEIAGQEFNLSSPKQLSYILFEKLKLPPVKKTKTGYSTDAEVLMTLSSIHPLPEKILQHRHYAKLKSTYLDTLESVINPVTGRIHSNFHQTVTATGRLSSSEPNLQNIPVRTESGRAIREIFIPAPGKLFLASDYSQIELRVMAHMSGDESMVEAFRRDQDIHRATASEMFGVPMDRVTPELRDRAKAVNFGVIYGISDFGLARNTGVSREEARGFIDAYFRRYPMVKRYMDEMVEQARQTGYVTTILGRRRPIPDIRSRNRARRGFAERTAINTPIQGSAADLIKLAMVRLHRRIMREGLASRIILQVHDELVFEIPPEEEDCMVQVVKEEMEGVMELKVPLKVEIDVGESWAHV
jgi:DNA polymerase-1